jgi:hypothetical protein
MTVVQTAELIPVVERIKPITKMFPGHSYSPYLLPNTSSRIHISLANLIYSSNLYLPY